MRCWRPLRRPEVPYLEGMPRSVVLLLACVLTSALRAQGGDEGILGVDFKSFGVAALPGGFEELTTASFNDTLQTGTLYEIELMVDKDLYLARQQRPWSTHRDMQFEVTLFLAVTSEHYDPDRSYEYVVYERTGARTITLRQNTERFQYVVYADAPYGLLTVGYRPVSGWWDADRDFVEDILQITSLTMRAVEPAEDDDPDADSTAVELPGDLMAQVEPVDSVLDRRTRPGTALATVDDSITVRIYDHLEVDGDSIRVLYNDSVVLDAHALTGDPAVIRLPVRPGQNHLALYALNLGDLPPNTAAFDIILSDRTERRILYSDLEASDVVYVLRRGD